MAKKVPIDFGTASTEELIKHLNKLKAAEAKMEVALLLREHPEIEEYLYRLITAVTELKNIEKMMVLEDKDTDKGDVDVEKATISRNITRLKSQIKRYSADEGNPSHVKLVATYKVNMERLQEKLELVGVTKTMLKFKERYDTVLTQFRGVFKKWQGSEVADKVDLHAQVPFIFKYVEE
jgi:hypothetical protein